MITAALALFTRYRAAIGIALQVAVVLAIAGFSYHTGVERTTDRYELVIAKNEVATAKAIATFHKNADAVTAASAARLAATLATERTSNEAIARTLHARLEASELRNARLGRDVRRLLDAAASGGTVASPEPAGPSGGTPGAAEDDDPATCADLAETAVDNYGIARRNAARLTELQQWYRDLQKVPPTVNTWR